MAALDAAMTSVPKLLMADWMMILATAKTALWIPAGRPILTIRLRATGSIARSRRGDADDGIGLEQTDKERDCADGIGDGGGDGDTRDAPVEHGDKDESRPMLRTVDTASACSGMRVMPTERKIAASKL